MNPHDPHKRPGAHRVYSWLGAEDPRALSANHPPDSPSYHLARTVATAARDVDLLHRDLTIRIQRVIEPPEPIAREDHPTMREVTSVIQSAGFQIELIATRLGAAHEQLTRAIYAYEQRAEAGPLPPEPVRRHGRDNTPVAGDQSADAGFAPLSTAARDDPKGFDRRALQEIKRGDLWLQEDPVSGEKFLTYGSGMGADPFPETVADLIADGLVIADTNPAPHQPGRLLSLTPQGEDALAALEASYAADRRRVLSALHRSPAPAPRIAPVPSAATAPLPTLPSRTR
ncbi:hypothetical protein E6W39_06690 [Kitasatospora acidiphila]|uniref:Uncharacterized protein n=1 Tax=Kitasatospora acidiphila TaxID=2567942 RepID=A0A540VZ62_9ACTN|nr:hypothetical protein [Kitasatospora acidiphila]TQF02021.1 hypothetical protein E6W39_06690 [Kitasatospora acidiphila]